MWLIVEVGRVCFHTINAYEEPSTTDPGSTNIIADLCAYDSLDVLKRFYLENMASDSPGARAYADPKYDSAKACYRRFRLPNVPSVETSARRSSKQQGETPGVLKAENVHKGEKGLAPELPSLSHSVRGKEHRFIYGVLDTGKSTFFDGVVKYDTTIQAPCATWSVFGQSAGEPIFVKDPSRPDEEDAGVLLTAVLDGLEGRSYLLLLDAKNLLELGRASMKKGPEGIIGFGFHGVHVQASVTSEDC
jgi:torulene dioxygenase